MAAVNDAQPVVVRRRVRSAVVLRVSVVLSIKVVAIRLPLLVLVAAMMALLPPQGASREDCASHYAHYARHHGDRGGQDACLDAVRDAGHHAGRDCSSYENADHHRRRNSLQARLRLARRRR
jgi:hypothetical protein